MDSTELNALLQRQLAGKSTLASAFGDSSGVPILDRERIEVSAEKVSMRLRQLAIGKNVTESQIADLEHLAVVAMNEIGSDDYTPLSLDRAVITEAVIEADGSRPVIDIGSGGLILDDLELGDWDSAVTGMRDEILRVADSVGRVDAPHLGAAFAGTGFAVGDHLIMTNMHVLKDKVGRQNPDGSWRVRPNSTIDFGKVKGAPDNPTRHFPIIEVVHMSTVVDICVLRCAPNTHQAFPAPLPFISDDASLEDGRDVFLVGFPARPRRFFADAPPPEGHERIEVIRELFRDRFGFKRISIGEILEPPGFLGGGDKASIFSHDASTLAGSSGSCVVDLATYGDRGVGIHYGGRSRDENRGHALPTLRAEFEPHGVTFL